MSHNRHTSWIILPFLLSGIAATAAYAGPTRLETTKISLRYDPRQLSSPAAARRLLERIGNAALEACGASPFSLAEYKMAIRSSRCWRDAVDDAVRHIRNPTLSALNSEGGQ